MKNLRQFAGNVVFATFAVGIVAAGFCPKDASAQARPATSQPAAWPAGKAVGWRGDDTGHYPDATPPTEWYLKPTGESKNILWKVKLPCYSWSMPVIVGDRVFTRSEPYDLICLDKKDGKLLWIRSQPSFLGITDENAKASPGYKEVAGLVSQLEKINGQFVKNGWTAALYKQKHDLQKQIDAKTDAIDKNYTMPKDMYVESFSGYTAATPCSDGKNLYFVSGSGVTACYDLDGNLKWSRYESMANAWGEHGGGTWCSPALVGNTLLINTKSLYALDKNTGKELWNTKFPVQYDPPYAIIPFKCGGADYAIANGFFFRVSDGKIFAHPTRSEKPPQVNGNLFYFGNGGQILWRSVQTQQGGDPKVTVLTPTNKQGYQNLYIPAADESKKWESTNFYAASPLLHNGLMYVVTVQGWFSVADVVNDKVLYQKKLPLDFKNPWSRKTFGFGLGASPALGGKYLYIMDSAGCTLVLEPGREYKQIAKNNIDYTLPNGWEPSHSTGAHHEQTEASLVFDGSRIYIRGEQYLYCIAEK